MISGFITGLLMVASTVGVAILGLLLVRRLVPLDLLQMHHEVGGYIIGVMGTIYAVILAFVVFVVWNQYQMANAAVVAEANSLGDLSRMTRRLPEPLQTQLRGALVNYLEAVIHSEWPAMGRQSESQEAWSAMQKLWEIYRSADIPRDERTQMFYSGSLQQLNNLSDGRRTRLFASHGKVPTLMWVLLWLEGTITLGFTYFFGVRSIRSQCLMTIAFALVVSLNLFLILELDQPFSGLAQISPTPLEQELARITSGQTE
jgi:Protein of unknown function (DUF4239)